MTQANYYISFAILSESLEDPSFHLGKAIHVINVVLDYLYIGLLIMCYVLSLGNRPQGAKWGYKLAFVGFAFITIYMTVRSISTTLSVDRYNDALRVTVQFAAIFLAVKGIESVVRADRDFSLSTEFFANPLFRNIIFSVLATIGLYIITSLIFVRPSLIFAHLCVSYSHQIMNTARTMAHHHVIPPILALGAFLYICAERLCRASVPLSCRRRSLINLLYSLPMSSAFERHPFSSHVLC